MYRDIVGIGGDRFQELEGEADALQPGSCESRQEAVIITAPPTQAVPYPIKCHSGDEGKLNLGIVLRSEECSLRLHDAESTWHQGILALVEVKFQIIAYADGQQDALAVSVCFLNQRPDINLIGKGIIQKQGARLLPPGRTEHLATNLFRHCC